MANQNFNKDIELVPRVSPEFELTLDSTPVQHSIQTMNFFQMKGKLGLHLYNDNIPNVCGKHTITFNISFLISVYTCIYFYAIKNYKFFV